MIYRSLGSEEVAEPDIYEISLRPGDCLILATDGLFNTLSHDDLSRTVREVGEASAEQLAKALMGAALAKAPRDNVTVAVVRTDLPRNRS